MMATRWTAWLTWLVQVRPIFFLVGGYANGISWRAARRDRKSYAAWLEGRLRRLVWPVLPLLVVWVGIVAIEYARGVRPELISYGSRVAFTHMGPYPVSMISVPDDPISNTTPPKVTLIALAIMQGGLLLAAQAPARRWLTGRIAWTATVTVNGSIMTLFIWHLTATVLVILVAYLAGGFGLRLEPGSSEWWLARLPWLAANAIALVPLVVVFGRFERPRAAEGVPAPAWRYVLGAIATVAGLALLAAQGVGGYGKFGLNVWALALALAGVGLVATRIGASPR